MLSIVNEGLSKLGSVPCVNDSLIIAGGCSAGFKTLTNLDSLGTVTAALQVQEGDTSVLNTASSSFTSDHSTINPPLVSQPPEQHAPRIIRYDPLTVTTYFNDSSTVGGIIPPFSITIQLYYTTILLYYYTTILLYYYTSILLYCNAQMQGTSVFTKYYGGLLVFTNY